MLAAKRNSCSTFSALQNSFPIVNSTGSSSAHNALLLVCGTMGTPILSARDLLRSIAGLRGHITGKPKMFPILLAAFSLPSRVLWEMEVR